MPIISDSFASHSVNESVCEPLEYGRKSFICTCKIVAKLLIYLQYCKYTLVNTFNYDVQQHNN